MLLTPFGKFITNLRKTLRNTTIHFIFNYLNENVFRPVCDYPPIDCLISLRHNAISKIPAPKTLVPLTSTCPSRITRTNMKKTSTHDDDINLSTLSELRLIRTSGRWHDTASTLEQNLHYLNKVFLSCYSSTSGIALGRPKQRVSELLFAVEQVLHAPAITGAPLFLLVEKELVTRLERC